MDDILIFGKTGEIIECFIEEFRRHVTETKVYPDVKKYLGMELVEQDGKIYVSQENYISKIIRKYTEKGRSRRQKNPISMSLKLEDVQNENEETWDIRDLVGSLRYVADCTRRDILTALSIISAKAGRASESYCKGADQIIDYLLTTCGSYLEFSQNKANNLYLYAFTDASFNNDVDEGDRLGGCFFLGFNNAAFYCYSKKDKRVSKSPMDAEIKAIGRAVELVCDYRELCKVLGFPQMGPTPIFTDSLSAVVLFNKGNISKFRTNKRLYNNIKKLLNERVIMLVEIPGELNCSNSLTKITTGSNFYADKRRYESGYDEETIRSWISKSLFGSK